MINELKINQTKGPATPVAGQAGQGGIGQGIGEEFSRILKNSIDDLDATQKKAEAAMSDIATGQVKDLHQATIAINKAETSMKFMLEVRNKAINAYKEITRTQI